MEDGDKNKNHEGEEEEEGLTEAQKSDLQIKGEANENQEEGDENDIAFAKSLMDNFNGIEVKVQDPEEVKAGLFEKNYTVYTVVGKDNKGAFNVKRRFKEFEALRLKLKANWPGIFIPAIPDKAVSNKGSTLISERLIFLDHFMKKCARMEHIFESEEMQIFLKSAGKDTFKLINDLPLKSSSTIYQKYSVLFPSFDKEASKEMMDKVKKRINNIQFTVSDVTFMRTMLKKMREYRGDFKHIKSEFAFFITKDILNKIKDPEVVEVEKKRVREYSAQEKLDDITVLLSKLKVLLRDLESFSTITNDLTATTNVNNAQQTIIDNCTKELDQIKSSDKEVVSGGLFKKVPKEVRISELEKQKELATEELRCGKKLLDLLYHLLNDEEVPLIYFVKNAGYATGINELHSKRKEALIREGDWLENMKKFYSPYL